MIFIDYRSRVPIYEQIKEKIIVLINMGVYKEDDQLPSIRALSKELNINVNTIKRAFSELEKDGVIYSVQGRGVFVSANPLGNKKIISSALENIRVAVRSGKAKGVLKSDVMQLIADIYKEDGSNDRN